MRFVQAPCPALAATVVDATVFGAIVGIAAEALGIVRPVRRGSGGRRPKRRERLGLSQIVLVVRMSPMHGGGIRASGRIGHDRGGEEDSEG
jgi:hypothetical protein